MNNHINFSYNWNNKLDCKAFTTLRLSGRFNVGDEVVINLNHLFVSEAVIIGKKTLLLQDLNDYIAYLDTGYNKDECKKILMRMYPEADLTKQKIHFYLIKKID